MLTARRMRERQQQEAAGLPPPPPRRPLELSIYEHDRIVNELRTQHAKELEAAGKGGVDPKSRAFQEAEEAATKLGEAAKALEESTARVTELESENARLTELLEQATAKPAGAPPKGEGRKPNK